MKSFKVCQVIAAIAMLNACSSAPPAPATPDGSVRVPANAPGRVQALQDRVAADKALVDENNLLKAQVNALQLKLNEMTSIVKEALVLPAPQRPAPTDALQPQQPQLRQSTPQFPATAPAPVKPVGLSELPKEAYSVNGSGVVIRVFHDFARTDFEPSEEVAKALREATHDADAVVVRGRTDSETVNPIDRLIAIERAMKARTWLIDNGVSAAKITTRFTAAGQFIADNTTEAGRALNRRVEIDVRYAAQKAHQAKVGA